MKKHKMSGYPEVDCVFHEVAQAGVRKSTGSSFETYTRNNTEATQKLLVFYKSRKIKKLIYATSSSVYGDAGLPIKIQERYQRAVDEFVRRTMENYKDGMDEIILFGSVVGGEAKDDLSSNPNL